MEYPVHLSADGTLAGLGDALQGMPALRRIWEGHVAVPLFGCPEIRIATRDDAPACIDFLYLLAMASATQRLATWWQTDGLALLSAMLGLLAPRFELHVQQATAKGERQPLPLLRTTRGNSRRQETLNIQIAAAETRRAGGHGGTAQRLLSRQVHVAVSRRLPYVHVEQHMAATQAAFQGQRHLCCAWDPSLHSGEDTLVMVVYAPALGRAAYAPIQVCARPPEAALHTGETLDHVRRGKRLERLAAFTELVGVDHSLTEGFGVGLQMSAPWSGSVLRPLCAGEVREPMPAGGFCVRDTESGSQRAEIPPGAARWPGITHWVDQGSVGAAGLNFCMHRLGYHMVMLPDPNHRVWNDIKGATQRCAGFYWKTIVQMTLVFNLNYGPYGKGRWFHDKRAFFEEWLSTVTEADAHFLRYAPQIAEDVGLPPPVTAEDRQRVLAAVKHMQSFRIKGPLVKMMRWFSWFESAAFYSRELHAVRMILEAYMHSRGADESEAEEPAGAMIGPGAVTGQEEGHSKAAAQEELRALKAKQGSWRTAAQCITSESVWRMRCLQTAVKPLWRQTAWRTQHVRTPEQALTYEVGMSRGAWQADVVEVVTASLHDGPTLRELGLTQSNRQRQREIHLDLLLWLARLRADSLVQHSEEPPRSLAAILSADPAERLQARERHLREWRLLLRAEEMHNAGSLGRHSPLERVGWRHNRWIRLIHALLESGATEDAEYQVRCMFTGFGDSKVIEDIHQHIRDVDRGQRHQSTKSIRRMCAVLESGVLRSRGIPEVGVTDAAVAQAPRWATPVGAVQRRLVMREHSKRVPQEWAALLCERTWHSPAASALAGDTAAWRWIVHCLDPAERGDRLAEGWLTSLLQFKDVILEPGLGLAWLVLVPSSWAVLAWRLERVESTGAEAVWTFASAGDAAPLRWKSVDSRSLEDWVVLPTEVCHGQEVEVAEPWRHRLLLRTKGPAEAIVARALAKGPSPTATPIPTPTPLPYSYSDP